MVLLHVHISPFAVRANSYTGSVGRGHVWPAPFKARGLVVSGG